MKKKHSNSIDRGLKIVEIYSYLFFIDFLRVLLYAILQLSFFHFSQFGVKNEFHISN